MSSMFHEFEKINLFPGMIHGNAPPRISYIPGLFVDCIQRIPLRDIVGNLGLRRLPYVTPEEDVTMIPIPSRGSEYS